MISPLKFPSSSPHSSCLRAHPAWQWVNLRMPQICFPCGLMLEEADTGDAARSPTHPGLSKAESWDQLGQSFTASRPSIRILDCPAHEWGLRACHGCSMEHNGAKMTGKGCSSMGLGSHFASSFTEPGSPAPGSCAHLHPAPLLPPLCLPRVGTRMPNQ